MQSKRSGRGQGGMTSDLEQLVFLGPKGADEVSDVVANDDDLTTLRVLRCQHGHPPRHHGYLEGMCTGLSEYNINTMTMQVLT